MEHSCMGIGKVMEHQYLEMQSIVIADAVWMAAPRDNVFHEAIDPMIANA